MAIPSEETIDKTALLAIVQPIRRYKRVTNRLQCVGMVTSVGSFICLTQLPANIVVSYTLYTGLALTVISAVLSIGFHSIADVAATRLFVSDEELITAPPLTTKAWSSLSIPRRIAIFGGILTAGSMLFLAIQGFPECSFANITCSADSIALLSLITGLAILAVSAICASLNTKALETKAIIPENEYRCPLMRFESATASVAGMLFLGSTVVMMTQGIVCPGVQLWLTGIGFLITSLVLHYFYSSLNEYDFSLRKLYRSLPGLISGGTLNDEAKHWEIIVARQRAGWPGRRSQA